MFHITYNLINHKTEVLRKIDGKTKINRITSQQIRESFDIQTVNEWGKRREWDEQVTRMDAVRLVKISRENKPADRSSSGLPKRWSELILD